MKHRPLWILSITTTSEAEEAAGELLTHLFLQSPSSYTNLETGEVTVSVCLPERPERFRAALRGGLARIKDCRLNLGAGWISLRRLPRQNWAESWKRHFKPMQVGSSLLIKPGWSGCPARKGQAVVLLDPGLSFGTGQHPTTAFCLRQLAARRVPGKRQSFLDMGTGSGILAIAAAKLGYAPVKAFDSDREAVRIARANARRNHVADQVRIRWADLTELPTRGASKHDLICANLVSDLLRSERKRIIARLKPNGVLILAGILKSEFARVARAYQHSRLKLVATRAQKEWQSGAFRYRN